MSATGAETPGDLGADILILRFPAPDLPISENESRRLHWASRRRRTDPWKEAAQTAWLMARRSPAALAVKRRPASVLVWIPFLNRRRRDPHNFVSTVVKPIIDGLTDCHETVPPGRRVRTFEGLWPDDTPDWVEIREPKLYVANDCVVEVFPRLPGDEMLREGPLDQLQGRIAELEKTTDELRRQLGP